jgi:hypothetical protein
MSKTKFGNNKAMKQRIIIAILLAVGCISTGVALAIPIVQTGGTAQDVAIGNGNKLSLDGSTNNYLSSPGSNQVAIFSGGTQTLTANNGNVGIGTSSPNGKLHVSSSNSAAIGIIAGQQDAVRFGADSSAAYVEGVDKTGTASYQPLLVQGSVLRFATGGTEYLHIDGSGNVGIGTTSPAQKLEVNGNEQLDGNLTGNVAANHEFKITAPSGIPICIGTGC